MIHDLLERALAQVTGADSLAALEQIRVQYLGKSGELTSLKKELGKLPLEERKSRGQAVNSAATQLEEAIAQRNAQLQSAAKPVFELDVTLPGRRRLAGHFHPLAATAETMKKILIGLGFSYDDYPDIETEEYNFDALNTPAWHPARDLHDTFYTAGDGRVLRTHTTAFQARVMRASGGRLPIRAMTTGRCYRADDIDASHFPIFQQLDAFAIGKNITMSDLRWTLTELARGLFGSEVQLRFRPSYFPFTTPSAEVDVSCIVCKQQGCGLCSRTGWLEVLGSGMMRPEVLRYGGFDSAEVQGFAFGIGVDRITMLRHRINDIRLLYQNEEAFLRQF